MIEMVKEIMDRLKPKPLALKSSRNLHVDAKSPEPWRNSRYGVSPTRDARNLYVPDSFSSRANSRQMEKSPGARQALEIEKQKRVASELQELRKQEEVQQRRDLSDYQVRVGDVSANNLLDGEEQKSQNQFSRTSRVQSQVLRGSETQHASPTRNFFQSKPDLATDRMQLLPSPIDHYTRQDSASSKYRPGFFHKEEAERILPDIQHQRGQYGLQEAPTTKTWRSPLKFRQSNARAAFKQTMSKELYQKLNPYLQMVNHND